MLFPASQLVFPPGLVCSNPCPMLVNLVVWLELACNAYEMRKSPPLRNSCKLPPVPLVLKPISGEAVTDPPDVDGEDDLAPEPAVGSGSWLALGLGVRR